MSFASEASKLITNKYFLYFMVFLASTNVLGYLVTNKLNAVIFFALVSLLTYQFSKNMSVILLIAIIATNFMMSSKIIREGLENSNTAIDKASSIDDEIAKAVPIVKNSKTGEEAKEKMNSVVNHALSDDSDIENNKYSDINNTDLNKPVPEAGAPEGAGEKIGNKKSKTNENFGPRLDYAATIEQSYSNLDELLGSDSIKQLTTDTQKLMSQQQNLFNTMNQMVPVLEGAQNMLKGFDMSSLTNSLKGISSLGGAPTAMNKK
jgi:hypothetical protein